MLGRSLNSFSNYNFRDAETQGRLQGRKHCVFLFIHVYNYVSGSCCKQCCELDLKILGDSDSTGLLQERVMTGRYMGENFQENRLVPQ